MANFPNSEGRKVVLAQVQTILDNKAYLSEVDGKIGDGDHGINMAKGFQLIRDRLGDKEVTLSDGLGLIGKTLMTEIGGSMGPIYGTFFIQMSLKCKNKPETDAPLFGEMLKAAREGLHDLGGAKVGDKTLMDAVIPAEEAYQAAVDKGASLQESLKEMAVAAEKGKDSTVDLVAKIGRSARLGERSRGVLDAGATSAALILQTFCRVLGTSDEKSSSSGAETTRPEIPIARNANPAGLSTARPVQDIPIEVEEKTGEAAPATAAEIPIARNANPAGVSTSRPRE